MSVFRLLRPVLASLGLSLVASGQVPITDVHLTGSDNQLETGGTFTISSGATFTAAAGSTIDFSSALAVMPSDLILTDTHLLGPGNQLEDQAVFTLASGATVTASVGSTVDLHAATVSFPTNVVLTNTAQTLFGKTLFSPVFSGTVTAAANTDLTLVPGSNSNNVIIGGTDAGSRLDLGTGPAIDGYFQPVTWSSGSGYYLTGGHATFTSPGFPAGIVDNLGGLGYNSGNPPVAGDAQFGLGYESRYQNDPQGVDTEFYYYWNGPVGVMPESGGRSTRRIYQANVSWGTQYGAPSSKKMGYANWGFDVDRFFVSSGTLFSGQFLLDFTASPNPVMTWQGAANFSNGLTVGGGLTITGSGSATNSFTGATTIAAANANYVFSSGNDSVLNIANAVHDAGLKIRRNGINGSEYLALGAASGGTLFGGASNAYSFDAVSPSPSTMRDIIFRSSADGGVTYATALSIQPRNSLVAIPYTTASTSTTSGALTVAGGVGVGGSLYAGNLLTSGTLKSYGASNNTYVALTSATADATLSINSNTANNFRSIVFSYGAAPTKLWALGFAGYFPNTWVGFYNQVSGGAMMASGNKNWLIGNTNTDMSGSYNLSVEGGVIDTRTINPLVLRVNGTTALTLASATRNATFSSTTSGTSPTAAAVVANSAGIAENLWVGGQLNVTATAAATSTSTGAAIVNGGLAVKKKAYLGDDALLVPTAAPAATVRLSGTAVTGSPGIWFSDNGTPTANNAALLGSSNSTTLNGPAGGSLKLGVAGNNYLTVSLTGATLEAIPLNVATTTASTSTATGSATFAGGIGVSGRTSTRSLSVGADGTASPVNAILSATFALDFPLTTAGGVQDLSVSVPGAAIGDAVNVVEADGAFVEAGLLLHAVVTGSDTVTVRVTNVTGVPIDPAAGNYRVTVIKF